MKNIKIIECPRDAMQGFHHNIATEQKVEYIDALLKVGFDVLDCGSFVSAKAVPMLADTTEVLNAINIGSSKTKLLVIVANERGAIQAASFSQVDIIGYPFSISEQFQLRNTNHTIAKSLDVLNNLIKITSDAGKELVVYLSMGFGNPYKEEWNTDLSVDWCKKIAGMGIRTISLSDTIGLAMPKDINTVFKQSTVALPQVEFGAHFHTRADNYKQNIAAAYEAGCRRFDTAMRGFGGCPFAADELTGNLPTESLIAYLKEIGENTNISKDAFEDAFLMAGRIFI